MKNWIKISLSLMVIIVYATMVSSSAKKKFVAVAPPPPTFKVPSYAYTPPAHASISGNDLKILVVEPTYNSKFKYADYRIFTDFKKFMSGDINESLTTKGYLVRGPFETYEGAMYSDKTESDLLLNIELDLDLNDQNINWKGTEILVSGKKKTAVYTNIYKLDGYFTLSGKVNISISEPITKEKIWVKNVPLKQRMIRIASKNEYKTYRDYSLAFETEPIFANPFIPALQDYYKEILDIAWASLDPNELTTLKKYVKEIREKKKY
jgi:hypothetical protein